MSLSFDALILSPDKPAPLWRDRWAWALLALALAIQAWAQVAILRETGGRFGAPLDDTFIHLNFARSLMRGQGFCVNPGQPVPGSTSPAWVVLIAATAMSERWLLGAAIAWSIAFYAAIGLALYHLARKLELSSWAAFFAAAMTLACGRILWAGALGMEPTAFAFFSLVGVESHLNDRRRGSPGPLTALLLGVAAGFRPEGYLLYAIAVLDHAIAYDPATRLFRLTFRPFFTRRAIASAAIFVLLIAPYMAFCLSASGHLLPNTYYIKRCSSLRIYADIYLRLVGEFFFGGPLGAFFAFAPLGAVGQMRLSYTGADGRWEALRRARILWLWPLGFVAILG
ncbi:MAG: hypothetical protein NTW86_09130, partial [Candidatus Sumerlaeota bacterium]|nr:hypothetical protein [Candidatus Sumerlaeota bacterium]